MLTVTKQFEFCYAHQLTGHPKCGNLHGHNGILEVEISGPVYQNENGMILDFTDLKDVVKGAVIDEWDHSNLNDCMYFKTFPPTAEHMVIYALKEIRHLLEKLKFTDLKVERVRVYETSTSWAEWRKDRTC